MWRSFQNLSKRHSHSTNVVLWSSHRYHICDAVQTSRYTQQIWWNHFGVQHFQFSEFSALPIVGVLVELFAICGLACASPCALITYMVFKGFEIVITLGGLGTSIWAMVNYQVFEVRKENG